MLGCLYRKFSGKEKEGFLRGKPSLAPAGSTVSYFLG